MTDYETAVYPQESMPVSWRAQEELMKQCVGSLATVAQQIITIITSKAPPPLGFASFSELSPWFPKGGEVVSGPAAKKGMHGSHAAQGWQFCFEWDTDRLLSNVESLGYLERHVTGHGGVPLSGDIHLSIWLFGACVIITPWFACLECYFSSRRTGLLSTPQWRHSATLHSQIAIYRGIICWQKYGDLCARCYSAFQCPAFKRLKKEGERMSDGNYACVQRNGMCQGSE